MWDFIGRTLIHLLFTIDKRYEEEEMRGIMFLLVLPINFFTLLVLVFIENFWLTEISEQYLIVWHAKWVLTM